jgi:phosphopantothenoylcysteine decarboxylase/phosphopantothenate--cysteine ligase
MRILVTAGPTRERLDPVRFLSNRSSGKMGYAIAQAAQVAGHEVILVSGPVSLITPVGVKRIPVESAAEMLTAVERELPACDALIMAAAVADWRPATVSGSKLKKVDMDATLQLVRTPDILASLASQKGGRVFVGFAAETERVCAQALAKMNAKGLDMIVANDVSAPDAGFEVDTNRVHLITPAKCESLPLMSKREVGERIVEWLVRHAATCS